MLCAGALSGGLVSIYVLYPQIVVKIFGAKYFDAIDLVAPYGMAMFFVSITAIVMSYHLAIKNMRYIAFFTGFTVIEIALLMVFNSTMAGMINVLLIANLVLLVMSVVYTFRKRFKGGNRIKI